MPDSPHQLTISYGCGCSYVNWRVPARAAETHGWHLCPEHMAGFHAYQKGKQREFRIKHPCRCYYVVWRNTGGGVDSVGWHFCPDHLAELKAFDQRTAGSSG
jgi:hypothetical protein